MAKMKFKIEKCPVKELGYSRRLLIWKSSSHFCYVRDVGDKTMGDDHFGNWTDTDMPLQLKLENVLIEYVRVFNSLFLTEVYCVCSRMHDCAILAIFFKITPNFFINACQIAHENI